MLFENREAAGRYLSSQLRRYRGRPDLLVLALPRGGLPVGRAVAEALGAPLDVFLVRKLGFPGRPELAMGAIATGGVVVLNDDVVHTYGLRPDEIMPVIQAERAELKRRERLYRGDWPMPELHGRTVILVDDGLATGATMRAAVGALRRLGAAHIVVAAPVASREACDEVGAEVESIVCGATPDPFYAVGLWYHDFREIGDEEVVRILTETRAPSSGKEAT
jgi:putative phosphoribosyl transferase